MRAFYRVRVSGLMALLVLCQSIPFTVRADAAESVPAPIITNTVQDPSPSNTTVEPTGEIIVKFRRDVIDVGDRVGLMKAAFLGNDRSLITLDTAKEQNLALFLARDPYDAQSILEDLRSDPAVESAEYNVKMEPQAFPANDTLGSQLWGLDNTGQTVNGITGTADADINAPEAWAINEGTHADAVIAVIDTGVKFDHEDFQGNVWDGTNCKDENGNALGGCQHGYDYADDDTDPSPVSRDSLGYHGTHVAGTIAATKGNGMGVAGVAPHAKIMAIRTDFSVFSLVKSVDFARQNGATVLNASFGGNIYSQNLYDAFQRFTDAGGLVVAGAGNLAEDTDINPFYPASFDLPNMISVAATDQNDGLASFSNTGVQSVDVGAPGTNVISTSFVDGSVQGIFSASFGAPLAGWVTAGTTELRSGMLAGDTALPYGVSGAGSATTPAMDLSANTGKNMISFVARCETQYDFISYTDYMELSASTGGGWTFLGRFDELDLDDDANAATPSPARTLTVSLPPSLVSPTTAFRFQWITNGDSDTGTTGEGCLVDDLQVVNFPLIDNYETLQGTSMATPHVSGIAALIHGYTPQLTATDIRNIIMTTGDEKPALLGKTFTGMRVNAEKAMRRSDLVAPVIALQGVNPLTIVQGNPFVDPGATATDDIDGDITGSIVVAHSVNTAVPGDYIVSYGVSDAAGNASSVQRTVSVILPLADTTAPVITLLGGSPLTITVGAPFVDPGATALDETDGDVTGGISVTGTVDTNTPAIYVLTYSVTDVAGNTGTAERTVIVTLTPDITPPVLTLLGDNPLIIAQNQPFTDPGATALDDRDGDITGNIVVAHSVNTAVPGDYIVSYGVTDAAGNSASAQRTVSVVVVPDTTPPVLTLLGGSDIMVIAGDIFTDPGATALDDRDGDITGNIVVTGSVNVNIPDVYQLRYNVSDAAGNPAAEVTRTVTVIPRVSDDPTPQPQPAEQGSRGPQQGSGGGRGNDSRAILSAIAALVDLHQPEGGFDPAHPTPHQTSFLCSVQRMIRGDMPQSLVERMMQEVQRLTGLPQQNVTAFLADGHACDAVNVARQGGPVPDSPQPVGFPVAADGYPVSTNPTWNLCVRGNVFDPQVIRQNPDRDPRTGRAWSCDHYSHATNEWIHPDLGVLFMLVHGKGGPPVLTLPRGYILVNPGDLQYMPPVIKTLPPATPAGTDGALPPPESVSTAIEERRLRRTMLSIDGVPVRSERDEE